jgi:ribosomal protein S27E
MTSTVICNHCRKKLCHSIGGNLRQMVKPSVYIQFQETCNEMSEVQFFLCNRIIFKLKVNISISPNRKQEGPHSVFLPNIGRYRICACISRMHVQATPTFLGQEFGNNNNSYASPIRFYLCESKIFAIAFMALWLSRAAFTVICQWCQGIPTSGNRWCRLLSCIQNILIHR